MNAPVKEWSDRDGLEFFGHHLMGLCVSYRHKTPEDEGKPDRFAACSGTLITIRGAVCFLTAGHVLKKLDVLRTSASCEIAGAVLADTFGMGRVSDHPIPFALQTAQMHYVDEDGLDFGVIVLDPYYARLLAKNGVVALEKKNWIHQSNVTFDGYAMLGLPAEFSSERVSADGHGQVSPSIFRVLRLPSPPEGTEPTRYERFVGRIDRELPLKSVKGMSGGPIFGFNFGPPTRSLDRCAAKLMACRQARCLWLSAAGTGFAADRGCGRALFNSSGMRLESMLL